MVIKKRIITDTRFHSNNPVRQFSTNSIEASINARFLNAAGNPDSKEIALEYAKKMAKSNEKEREVSETRRMDLWNDDNVDMR